jgi:hypothetical protein
MACLVFFSICKADYKRLELFVSIQKVVFSVDGYSRIGSCISFTIEISNMHEWCCLSQKSKVG